MTQSAVSLAPGQTRGVGATLFALARNHYLLVTLSALAFLAIWEVVSLNVPPVILPSPAKVIVAFFQLTASGELVKATGQTIWPFAVGLVLAFIAGTAFGLILGIFRPAARVLDPYIFIFWSIPNIAWLPLFIAWFGVGNLTLVVFVFVSAVFPQLLTVEAGAKEADSALVEVARSLGGTKQEILRTVVLPSSIPYIIAGLRIAVGRALVGEREQPPDPARDRVRGAVQADDDDRERVRHDPAVRVVLDRGGEPRRRPEDADGGDVAEDQIAAVNAAGRR